MHAASTVCFVQVISDDQDPQPPEGEQVDGLPEGTGVPEEVPQTLQDDQDSQVDHYQGELQPKKIAGSTQPEVSQLQEIQEEDEEEEEEEGEDEEEEDEKSEESVFDREEAIERYRVRW